MIINLPARQLAVAWRNVCAPHESKSKDPHNQMVAVEIYDDSTIRLVTATGPVLVTSTVQLIDGAPPAIGDKPRDSYVVTAKPDLGDSIFKRILKNTKGEEGAAEKRVTLEVLSIDEADVAQQRLSADMVPKVLSINAGDQQGQFGIYDMRFPDWRAYWFEHDASVAMREFAAPTALLAMFKTMVDRKGMPRFSFRGDGKMLRFIHDGDPGIKGLMSIHQVEAGEDLIDQCEAIFDMPAHGEQGE